MTPAAKSPYAGYRFPGEVISHAVWLYFRFPLSLRMVEEMLAARGIEVSDETVRQWPASSGRPSPTRSAAGSPVRATSVGVDGPLYQPVDQVLVQSGRRSKPILKMIRAGMGAVGDENHENGLVSGTVGCWEQDQKTPATRHGLFRGSGPDQQAHEQPEIVPRNVDQVALANVLATTQPSSPHAAALQSVGEGAFDDLGPPSQGFLADGRAQADPVGVDGRARRLITVPTREGLALRLGNPRLPGAAIERLQHGT